MNMLKIDKRVFFPTSLKNSLSFCRPAVFWVGINSTIPDLVSGEQNKFRSRSETRDVCCFQQFLVWYLMGFEQCFFVAAMTSSRLRQQTRVRGCLLSPTSTIHRFCMQSFAPTSFLRSSHNIVFIRSLRYPFFSHFYPLSFTGFHFKLSCPRTLSCLMSTTLERAESTR